MADTLADHHPALDALDCYRYAVRDRLALERMVQWTDLYERSEPLSASQLLADDRRPYGYVFHIRPLDAALVIEAERPVGSRGADFPRHGAGAVCISVSAAVLHERHDAGKREGISVRVYDYLNGALFERLFDFLSYITCHCQRVSSYFKVTN